jgi:hypothetical protein
LLVVGWGQTEPNSDLPGQGNGAAPSRLFI